MRAKHGVSGIALAVCFAALCHASVVVDSGYFYWAGVTGPAGTTVVNSAADNLASESTSTAFAIDVINNGVYDAHQIDHLNDGYYGNSSSWIGQSAQDINLGGSTVTTGFAGVSFGSTNKVYNFSIGRDNLSDDLSGSYYKDRSDGTYYVQVTTAGTVDKNTADSAWTTIGSITLSGGDSHRQQFNLNSSVQATGLRVVVPSVENLGIGTCIDEIEVNTSYAAKVANKGAVAYWRLGEAAGATTAVNSGTAGAPLNGTYNPSATGKVDHVGLIANDSNTAAHFSASSSQYVSGSGLDSTTASDGATANLFKGDWTIECSFVRDSASNAGTVFSNNVGEDSCALLTFGDEASNVGSGNTLYIMNSGVTWGGAIGIDLGADSIGKSVYAVLTKTGVNTSGNALVSMYVNVDGTWLTPILNQALTWDLNTRDGYYIGRHNEGALYFDGTIDDVALYNSALSYDQVKDNFASAIPEPSTIALVITGLVGLLAYAWRKRKIG